jgi:excisionase family DNA binding protein
MTADGYTVAEAGRLLGVSPKRVRQLIADGRLPTVATDGPMRVDAQAVIAERTRRTDRPASTPGPPPSASPALSVTVETLLELVERVQRPAIEAAEHERAKRDATRDQIEAELKAEIARLSQELDALKAGQVVAAEESPRRRRWWQS